MKGRDSRMGGEREGNIGSVNDSLQAIFGKMIAKESPDEEEKNKL